MCVCVCELASASLLEPQSKLQKAISDIFSKFFKCQRISENIENIQNVQNIRWVRIDTNRYIFGWFWYVFRHSNLKRFLKWNSNTFVCMHVYGQTVRSRSNDYTVNGQKIIVCDFAI